MAHAVGVMNGNFRGGMYYEYRQQLERSAKADALLATEYRLMKECYELEGDVFIDWYESDAVPAYGSTSERIKMIEQRIQSIKDTNPAAEAYQMEDKNTEADELASDAQWLNSDLSANFDGRNEIEHAQITATFGKVKVTTSPEWRRRHLHQTAAEVEAARVQAEMLKGLRS